MTLFHWFLDSLTSFLIVDEINYWVGIFAFGIVLYALFIKFFRRG